MSEKEEKKYIEKGKEYRKDSHNKALWIGIVVVAAIIVFLLLQ